MLIDAIPEVGQACQGFGLLTWRLLTFTPCLAHGHPASLSSMRLTHLGRARLGLAAFGGTAGPLVDSIHNQALLSYDKLPVSLLGGTVQTSYLIPPLLAIAYVLLGSTLPAVAQRVVGSYRPLSTSTRLPARFTAVLAVSSTIAIIKASEILVTGDDLPTAAAVGLLFGACLVQWAALDGSLSSLALAALASVGGPIAETPLMALGCWHYIQPDYFPFAAIGANAALGLSYITAPCYFGEPAPPSKHPADHLHITSLFGLRLCAAVTTDAIALGRWLGGEEEPTLDGGGTRKT